MNNLLLHVFENGHKTAQVFTRGDEFRVFLYNSYLETQDEKYFTTEQQAENFAEDWVLE